MFYCCDQGTLRVLLVLLHDFPEFLCDYHYTFCDVIPPNCIQMRNLVLSAFPRQMRLPDPFTPNLKVDNLPDITQAPRILTNYVGIIQPPSFKKVCHACIFYLYFVFHAEKTEAYNREKEKWASSSIFLLCVSPMFFEGSFFFF